MAGRTLSLTLPGSGREVLPGLVWGQAACPFTPAFWAAQVWLDRNIDSQIDLRWGPTLIEEIAGCLLGGHGITWEMNRAAFRRVFDSGALTNRLTVGEATKLLAEPFWVDNRYVRYRFPYRKGAFLAAAINRLHDEQPPVGNPLEFRNWLTTFHGVGLKTASWITRNFLNFSRVAVVDVHVFRACVLMRLFSGKERIACHYHCLENRYLQLADGLGVNPQCLDVTIWKTMRQLPSSLLNGWLAG